MTQVRTVFGRNLRAFRESRGMTQVQLSDALGVSIPTENKWENKGIQPRRKVIDDLIALYGLTEDDLLSDENGYYRKFHGLQSAPPSASVATPSPSVPVSIVGAVHAASADEPWEFDGGDAMLMSELHSRHPRCFALEVNGTCMDRVFTDSDVVFIDPDMQPRDGSIAVMSIDGECLVRRVKMGNGSMLLVSESHEPFDDVFVGAGSDARCIGCVFWWQAKGELC